MFGDVTDALAAVRHYQSRPGVSLNLEQQVTETVGVFARAGWADGDVEPWDFAISTAPLRRAYRSRASSGAGRTTRWEWRASSTGFRRSIAYFNAGGLGILVGDGALPNYGLEQIVEAYYSYALSATTKVSVDYQFIANPAYNADRGPLHFRRPLPHDVLTATFRHGHVMGPLAKA